MSLLQLKELKGGPFSHLGFDKMKTIPGFSACQVLLQNLLENSLVLAEDWEKLPREQQTDVITECDQQALLERLVSLKLLTPYQAGRVRAGKTFGLVLGNYRVLERLDAGAMGVIFKGEHILMRREVAIKVLAQTWEEDSLALERFFTEMRAVARLQHPNIVAALDAGVCASPDQEHPKVHYIVMEYVPGKNLEEMVRDGPLGVEQACDLMFQVASALDEAHKNQLVHRDIKPSNIMVTPDGQAKLLDFGLARYRRGQGMTDPGTVLGTVDFMAPEQAQDATNVDIRADLYSLGGVLFYLLTGRLPFPTNGSLVQQVLHRQTQLPPEVRSLRPDLPVELEPVLCRLMALAKEDRYPHPQAVMRALLPFLRSLKEEIHGDCGLRMADPLSPPLSKGGKGGVGAFFSTTTHQPPIRNPQSAIRNHRILIVDDERPIRELCRFILTSQGFHCLEAGDGQSAQELLEKYPCDLVLLDIEMPGMSGRELLPWIRQNPPCNNLKVVMISGGVSPDEMARLLEAGANDFLVKPVTQVQLLGRVKAALDLKDSQDRSEHLNRQLLVMNAELEKTLSARDSDLVHTRNALVLALSKLSEYRTNETGAHLVRLQRFCRLLAETLSHRSDPPFPPLSKGGEGGVDQAFITLLECCAPLHDIGNMGLPDHILNKAGKLDPEERLIMQTHTTIGAETLQMVARRHGQAVGFLQMAIDLVRHHHERYDGSGYPDRLSGDNIPLAARILSLADVYDALRSRRPHRPGLSHTAALQVLFEVSPGQFDPLLLLSLRDCAPQFERTYREYQDGSNVDF